MKALLDALMSAGFVICVFLIGNVLFWGSALLAGIWLRIVLETMK